MTIGFYPIRRFWPPSAEPGSLGSAEETDDLAEAEREILS